jgi:hypothetical protein
MFRLFTVPTLVAVLLSAPALVRAGGLPMLYLPVDGASAKSADACAQSVVAALGKEIDGVSFKQNDGQWYLMFCFNRDRVRLADIEAALQGNSATIRYDKLRLFGDVILEINVPEASADKLVAALKSVKHVSVEESKREDNTLLVTLKLPAPVNDIRRALDFSQISFQKETFRGEGAAEPAANLGELPTYESLRKVVEKHDAKLQGLRWDYWHCRSLGCLAGPSTDGKSAQAVNAR